MRFVIAIVLFVVAFVSIGYGLAQRTVLAGPSSVTENVSVGGDAPVTVIDSRALHAYPGAQTITVSGSKTVFIAAGRSLDVKAWVGKADNARVGWSAKKQALTVTQDPGTEKTVPSPAGSDLWVQQFSGTNELTRKIIAPDDVSVLIASDGKKAAPGRISISWPVDNSAPLSGPLIIGGIAVLLLGLIAFLWALVHARRRRGPRRKTPKLPRAPKPPQLKQGRQRREQPRDQKELVAPDGRRARRRGFVAIPVIVAGGLLLSACSTGTAVPSASPTATVPVTEQQQTAVTEPQLEHILTTTEQVVADADAKLDPAILATRMDGPALQLRQANYAIRKVDNTIAAVEPLPTGKVTIALPQQSDTWPRSVFAVIQDAKNAQAAPVAVMLVQKTPRENYKIEYATTLELDIPAVAPPEVGAARLPVDNKLGMLEPSELATSYGDILINGDASKFAKDFAADGDKLRTAIGSAYKASRKASLPSTAAIAYTNVAGPGPVIAFGSNDSGQIVAVDDNDIETITPAEQGAAINPSGAVKALSGKSSSGKGITATYGVQLLFYVPPVSATGKKIQLLGFAQGLIAASEVP
ncbi:MAG TPA: hypothetical protein VN759_09020 [Pseudolysinimonas sp.]|nr:hypothetical protein [Pseudolysinimonas sp.]